MLSQGAENLNPGIIKSRLVHASKLEIPTALKLPWLGFSSLAGVLTSSGSLQQSSQQPSSLQRVTLPVHTPQPGDTAAEALVVETRLLIATGDPGTAPDAGTYIGELRTHVAHSYESGP